jgi:hypothetical protein
MGGSARQRQRERDKRDTPFRVSRVTPACHGGGRATVEPMKSAQHAYGLDRAVPYRDGGLIGRMSR